MEAGWFYLTKIVFVRRVTGAKRAGMARIVGGRQRELNKLNGSWEVGYGNTEEDGLAHSIVYYICFLENTTVKVLIPRLEDSLYWSSLARSAERRENFSCSQSSNEKCDARQTETSLCLDRAKKEGNAAIFGEGKFALKNKCVWRGCCLPQGDAASWRAGASGELVAKTNKKVKKLGMAIYSTKKGCVLHAVLLP